MAVKDNQPSLHEDLKLLFDEAIASEFEAMGYDFHEQVDGDHGRVETRRVWVTRDVDWLRERGEWKDLRSVVCVEATREVTGKAPSVQRRYYITDLDHRDQGKDAGYFAQRVRSHRTIENQLHWCLDLAFDEDHCRVRQGYAPENLARLNRMTLNLLKQGKDLQTRRGRQTLTLRLEPRLPAHRPRAAGLDAIAIFSVAFTLTRDSSDGMLLVHNLHSGRFA